MGRGEARALRRDQCPFGGELGEVPEWLTYDIPRTVAGRAWKGRFRGQKQKWYALRFTGKDSEINVASPAGHKAEFIDWRWER